MVLYGTAFFRWISINSEHSFGSDRNNCVVMASNLLSWIDSLWIVFILIWALAAMKTKRAARRVSGWPRFVQIGFAITGAILLFDSEFSVGWLGSRLLPKAATLAWFGVAMTAGGIAFAVWARFVLGKNWSSQITVKEGHEFVRRGPYGLVRHPIYSGVLLALFGTAICIGELRGVIAFGLFIAGFWLKARLEETLLLEQFGEQYRSYQSEVKVLIPFVL
jgi:protein-S-isoprenylcysteine O-methyltransferase Ste14